ncbi:MAG: lytic transglycosylase [Anaeromyxobacter sp. RBG_16_69_14]|nr:MAG: lytic transglycosylase [Anaeromyxobacter sp. RBG_16_69_14]
MVRLLALVALLGMVGAPARGAAQDLYSFVDSDGVIHVTNVPQDPRFRRAGGHRKAEKQFGLHRIVLKGRAPPPLLRRASQYDDHIRAAAERYGLPVPLLKAVMAVESNFDPAAVSGKGATGLMQLMPGTARDMYVLDVYDPGQNIEGGARYLRHLHDQFDNDLVKVLAAYNAGPAAVRRSGGGVPPIRETQDYVRKVLTLYDSYLRGR